MPRIVPNAAAALMIWVAVIALVVIAWSQVRIAGALEDLADESMGVLVDTTSPYPLP